MCVYIHIYIYIYIHIHICLSYQASIGRGDATVGNPLRAQISRFELFELILLLKLGEQLPVERFEATVSQLAVPSPHLTVWCGKGG